MKYHVVLDVVPLTWKRHDKYGRNKPEYNAYKKLLQEEIWVHNLQSKTRWPPDYGGAVKLTLKFSGPGLSRVDLMKIGDIDNYAKAVMDSLQGVLIVNDRQIKEMGGIELLDGEPLIEIMMEEL